MKNLVRLREALHNLQPHSGANKDYACGVLVGCVSTLMAFGFTFQEAIRICSENAPGRVIAECCPVFWRTDFQIPITESESDKTEWVRTEGRP